MMSARESSKDPVRPTGPIKLLTCVASAKPYGNPDTRTSPARSTAVHRLSYQVWPRAPLGVKCVGSVREPNNLALHPGIWCSASTKHRLGDPGTVKCDTSTKSRLTSGTFTTMPTDNRSDVDRLCVGPQDSPERYMLRELRSSGGEGELWLGEVQVADYRLPVAVKILRELPARPLTAAAQRTNQQLELLRSIDHPNIVKVREAFIGPVPHLPGTADPESQTLYSVMNYIEGDDLVKWTARNTDRTVLDSAWIIGRLAAALEYLHLGEGTAGTPVLHRDVKPANVIITPDKRVVLVDFGMATLAGSNAVTVVGTPAFMAPEVIRGNSASAASDRYGLGATSYFLLTGVAPDPFNLEATRARLLAVAGVDDRIGFANHVMNMLAVEPANRPTALIDWAEYLKSFAQPSRLESSSRLSPELARLIGLPQLVPGSAPQEPKRSTTPGATQQFASEPTILIHPPTLTGSHAGVDSYSNDKPVALEAAPHPGLDRDSATTLTSASDGMQRRRRIITRSVVGLVLLGAAAFALTQMNINLDSSPIVQDTAYADTVTPPEVPLEGDDLLQPVEEVADPTTMAATRPPGVLEMGTDSATTAVGNTISVSEPMTFIPSETAAMGNETQFVIFSITIQNNSDEPIDPGSTMVTAASGNAESNRVFDAEQNILGEPGTPVLPGRSVTWEVAFGVLDPHDLTVAITPGSGTDPIIWTFEGPSS